MQSRFSSNQYSLVCFSPDSAPVPGLGRGVLASGKPGYFLHSDTNARKASLKGKQVGGAGAEVKVEPSPMLKPKSTKVSRKGEAAAETRLDN